MQGGFEMRKSLGLPDCNKLKISFVGETKENVEIRFYSGENLHGLAIFSRKLFSQEELDFLIAGDVRNGFAPVIGQKDEVAKYELQGMKPDFEMANRVILFDFPIKSQVWIVSFQDMRYGRPNKQTVVFNPIGHNLNEDVECCSRCAV